MGVLHLVLVGAVIALGLWLFGHPRLEDRSSRLLRGIAVWIAIILALRALDVLFLP